MSFLRNLLGDANARYLKSLEPAIEEINSLEPELKERSDEELRESTLKFRARLAAGETIDDLLPEAFASVREAARRAIGQRHFDVQLVGGMVLHEGKIAEMRTGEGKTLVATLPLYLNALENKGSYLVTPNDYLSRIGAGWMGRVYHALGMTAGVVTHDLSASFDPSYDDAQPHGDDRLKHFRPCTRRQAYEGDITYGTNNEFGFDYLRDNLEYSPAELRQRGHHYAIVDEVDSILIDEARTPLIISMPDRESADLYQVFARITPQLKAGIDYNVDEKMKAVTITSEGIDKVEQILGIGNIYEERGVRFVHHLESALRAHALYRRDREYVVRDGEVIIVDEFTGRLMPGRRWSEGLHQAVEAKEGVHVQQESRTLATITFQNYFRMYKKLSGMTGTAQTSAEEFHKVYTLDVISIPTHRPMIRQDLSDFVYQTEKGKYQALAREVKERHEKGQPILIGTVSIEKNEHLSKLLSVEGVPHEVLNAKNHEREALIIAQAGKRGAVTVATNLAGRGVDILLGGTPPEPEDADEVRKAGGLHVIGTERHEARRIDNQLRGRSGRQGDPGSSQFFVSFEDDLMRIFGQEKMKRLMETFGIPEDQPLEHKMMTRAIESAQSKIEGFHFDARKHVLEYDDVLNKQRNAIYRMRRQILFSGTEQDKAESADAPDAETEAPQSLKDQILEMVEEQVVRVVDQHTLGAVPEWNLKEIAESANAIAFLGNDILPHLEEITQGSQDVPEKQEQMVEYLMQLFIEHYEDREATLTSEAMREIERAVMLRSIDALWMDQLDEMEHLRDSVRLRAYGQRDPLVEYKNESGRLFRDLQQAIRAQIVTTIFKVGGAVIRQEVNNTDHLQLNHPDAAQPALAVTQQPMRRAPQPQPHGHAHTQQVTAKEPNRNDPCPCGSGKKYKKCHMT